jgi:hypothetical protein
MDEIQYEKILKFQGKIDNLIIMFAFIIIRFLPIIYIYFSLSICIHVLWSTNCMCHFNVCMQDDISLSPWEWMFFFIFLVLILNYFFNSFCTGYFKFNIFMFWFNLILFICNFNYINLYRISITPQNPCNARVRV